MAGQSKTSIRRLAAIKRQMDALELRKKGRSLQFIANELGYANASSVAAALESALKRTLQEPADSVRALEVQRLDELIFALWAKATSGDESTVNTVLKIMERRARLLGLDAPTKVAQTDPSGNKSVRLELVYSKEVRPLTDDLTDDLPD